MDNIFVAKAAHNSGNLLMLANTNILWPDDVSYDAETFKLIETFSNQHNITVSRLCLIKAASNVDSEGFRDIIDWHATDPQSSIAADGVMFGSHQSLGVGMQTADCPVVFASNGLTGTRGMYHCGRPAGMMTDGNSIITDMLTRLGNKWDMSHIEITVIGGISAEMFEHHDGKAKEQALMYLDHYGPEVFHDVSTLSLNMRRVIALEHMKAGVDRENIKFVGPDCTYQTPCCASHRRSLVEGVERTTANTILYLQ